MSRIDLHHVWQHYDGRPILENIHLSVDGPAFVTVVGASGCGKSTFLRLLLGQERPSRGHIHLDETPLGDEPNRDRGIVFQRYSLFPHLTVLQNLTLGLELCGAPRLGRLLGSPRRRAISEAEALLERVGLHSAAQRFPHQLSGGMQQRLSIAQSIITRPRILLLDEPFGALDPGIRTDMQQLVKALFHELGMTFFMVTHDLREAFSLGTRVLVFDKVRHDPQAPEAFGARITYDLPLTDKHTAAAALAELTAH